MVRCLSLFTVCAAFLGLVLTPGVSHSADKAGLKETLTYVADRGKADLKAKTYALQGNVQINQGGLTLSADEATLRQLPNGLATVTLQATGGRLVSFQQQDPGSSDRMVGEATKVDYDGRTGIVRLDGKAVLKRMRGSQVQDEITGGTITYNRSTEEFQVLGGAASGTTTLRPEGGRVRGTLTPRGDGAAGSSP